MQLIVPRLTDECTCVMTTTPESPTEMLPCSPPPILVPHAAGYLILAAEKKLFRSFVYTGVVFSFLLLLARPKHLAPPTVLQ